MAKSSKTYRSQSTDGTGIVRGKGGKNQSGSVFGKLRFRKRLTQRTNPEGAVYVPFCGDGDVAIGVYRDREIYAADIDGERVTVFQQRMPKSTVVAADCDRWPFGEIESKFSVADFDAFAYPYAAFWAFWNNAKKQYPLAMYFTDGQLQCLTRFGNYRTPDLESIRELSLKDRRKLRNSYWRKVLLEWIKALAAKEGLEIIITKHAMAEGGRMIYWGVLLDEKE